MFSFYKVPSLDAWLLLINVYERGGMGYSVLSKNGAFNDLINLKRSVLNSNSYE